MITTNINKEIIARNIGVILHKYNKQNYLSERILFLFLFDNESHHKFLYSKTTT